MERRGGVPLCLSKFICLIDEGDTIKFIEKLINYKTSTGLAALWNK